MRIIGRRSSASRSSGGVPPKTRALSDLPLDDRRSCASALSAVIAMARSSSRTGGRGASGVTGALRADLDRFTFLLGGNDGEHLLGEDPP
jgi:hypothetical protein